MFHTNFRRHSVLLLHLLFILYVCLRENPIFINESKICPPLSVLVIRICNIIFPSFLFIYQCCFELSSWKLINPYSFYFNRIRFYTCWRCHLWRSNLILGICLRIMHWSNLWISEGSFEMMKRLFLRMGMITYSILISEIYIFPWCCSYFKINCFSFLNNLHLLIVYIYRKLNLLRGVIFSILRRGDRYLRITNLKWRLYLFYLRRRWRLLCFS